MRFSRWLLCLMLLLTAGKAFAQDRPRPADDSRGTVPLNVQVVFSDYEGEKKVASIPYALSVMANDPIRQSPPRDSRLRMGVSVPIQTMSKEGQAQIQYMDVGVNIDCSAVSMEDGRYRLTLGVERSSIYATSGSEPPPPPGGVADGTSRAARLSGQPTLRKFRAEFITLIRDGQTTQNTIATDPVSGRVLKVDVTLSVVK